MIRREPAITAITAGLTLLLALPAAGGGRVAGLLSAQAVAVLDSTNAPRTTFSNNETISFSQTVFNGTASPNRTAFSFAVFAPNGNKVFFQAGNSVPGAVGNAAAQISGVPISGFYQGPGTYTLKASASLDAQNIQQVAAFTVSSPNILLIYPPNGATGLTDNPLTFQWFSSGAISYRVTVADNIALYNPVYQTTVAGVLAMTYPNNPNPVDPRQRLAAGQLYYWKVEGLDNAGNVIASSPVPFSFSVASVSLTRDLAVTDLSVQGPADLAGNVPFSVTVKNQGTTTESNVPLKFTLGGLPAPASPIAMPPFSPGDAKSFAVSAQIPTDQNTSLAIACITIFDDNVANNCRTLSVTRPPSSVGTGPSSPGGVQLSADQIWQAIQQLLKDQGIDLSAYQLTSMEGSLTRDELMALLDQLRQGQAQANVSGPPLAPPAPVPTVSSAPASAPTFAPPPSAPEAPEIPAEAAAPGEESQEWSGYTRPLAGQTQTFEVGDRARWRRLWQRLSDAPVPDVDFGRGLVVAILAGRGVKADRVEIVQLAPSGPDLVVRYRVATYARLGRPNAPALSELGTRFSPYLLKVVPRNFSKMRFELVKENTNE